MKGTSKYSAFSPAEITNSRNRAKEASFFVFYFKCEKSRAKEMFRNRKKGSRLPYSIQCAMFLPTAGSEKTIRLPGDMWGI